MKPEERSRLEALRASLDDILRGSVEEEPSCPSIPINASTLPLPYISQVGPGADNHRNDCGAAAGAMLVEAYTGQAITPDEFYRKTGLSGDRYLSAYQIMNVMKDLGVNATWYKDLTLPDLYSFLIRKRPVIALISYATLRTVVKTESSFTGPHFTPVVGMDVSNVYIHDPLWKEDGGKAMAVPINGFNRAWASSGEVNPNIHYGAIVPTAGIGEPQTSMYQAKVTATWLNVREGPDASYPTIGPALRYGEVVTVHEEEGKWGRIGPSHWIHLGYTERIVD